jgi:hypothetical protein
MRFSREKPFHTFPGTLYRRGVTEQRSGHANLVRVSLFWRQLLRRDIVIAGVGPTIHFGSPAWIVCQARDEAGDEKRCEAGSDCGHDAGERRSSFNCG